MYFNLVERSSCRLWLLSCCLIILASFSQAQSIGLPAGCPSNGSPYVLGSPVSISASNTFLSSGVLKISLRVPTSYSGISVNFINSTSSCLFNGASRWTIEFAEGLPNCMYHYVARVNWPPANCGFQSLVKPNYIEQNARFIVTTTQFVVASEGNYTRTHDHPLSLGLYFPTFVTTSSQVLTINNQISSGGYDNYTLYTGTSPVSGVIILRLTSVWPYIAQPIILSTSASDVPMTLTLLSQNCPDIEGSLCVQWFSIRMVAPADNSRCSFDGITVQSIFTYKCQPSTIGTNYCSNVQTTVTMPMSSGDWCAKTIVTVNLYSDSSTYSDSLVSKEKWAFLQLDTIYFRAWVQSNELSVTSTKLINLFIARPGYADITLFANESRTANGHLTLLNVTNSGGLMVGSIVPQNEIRAQLKISPSLVPLEQRGARRTADLTLKADLFVSFVTLSGSAGSKLITIMDKHARNLESSQSQAVSVNSKSITLLDYHDNQSSSTGIPEISKAASRADFILSIFPFLLVSLLFFF